MASHFLLVVLVASILDVAYATTSTTSVNLTAAATTTAYDVLEKKNNLPCGLLPNGVQSYTLNPEGKFEVTLPRECDFPHHLRWPRVQVSFRHHSWRRHQIWIHPWGVRREGADQVWVAWVKTSWSCRWPAHAPGAAVHAIISGQRLFREPIVQLKLRLI